ncbi:unnamed protein product [Cuscuta campestris]|uniref:Aluminum-activated malate transporter n=1 Tax=Cuscuta campestris TaxID=132261 RepID=A0A484M068_9ASTE|nr:unnamed protein product [Cuscuta campestris]
MVHSFKVGVALVLVSLLYVLDPLFHQVGQNVMWAIMTVVVVFEFYAGATISKGINRGIGTILGGLLGCLAAFIARKLGGFLHGTIVVAIAVFIVGVGATYVRMMPRIKRKYDYGALIFILTFNLVVVSGVRADKVILLARDRLSNIGMGFAVCVLTSLLLFPQWASDQLHSSTSSTFLHIASSLQGCLDEYMAISDEKKSGESADVSACKRILYSKANDESLANFAKWEPWHGKFGFSYPWDKYMEIGEALREVAAIVISLKACIIRSMQQPLTPTQRETVKEHSERVGLTLVWVLREMGESIKGMRLMSTTNNHNNHNHKLKLSPTSITISNPPNLLELMEQEDKDNLVHAVITATSSAASEQLGMSSFVFMMNEMSKRVEALATKVEQLGDIAEFRSADDKLAEV